MTCRRKRAELYSNFLPLQPFVIESRLRPGVIAGATVSCLNRSPLPWAAVYVKSRHEKNVELILRNKDYEPFLPTYPKRHRNSKKFDLPLFPGYVFCRLDGSTALPVLMIPGVFSIVSSGCVPAVIPDSEIEAIRQMLASGFVLSPWTYVCPGQEILLNSGPLRGIRGVVSEDSDEKWLVVSVHILQRSVAVKMDRASLSVGGISACAPSPASDLFSPVSQLF